MGKSLNEAQIIGNLTRDPELKTTEKGTAVCTFAVATNRDWKTSTGEAKEETEFHRIVAWEKLAELCKQLLAKGTRVYIKGRIQTRKFTAADGVERESTEIVANDMIVLSSRPTESVEIVTEVEQTTVAVA